MGYYGSQYNAPNMLSGYDLEAKNHALIAYILMVLGVFTGVLWFIGAIWAMVKCSDVAGSLFEDHYRNIITVFWWSLGWAIVGFALSIILVGYLILLLVWIWSAYRILRGLARLTSNRAYYDYASDL
ncbi:MAG: hypothetical protein CENE_03536 [Candidatus Celerinatantimonas neptuna]|nr:MAG: hypothetical protein CENE_03536 [Candidatus Celerinatantimonas neptuna]